MAMFGGVYGGKRVLVTGHTGFKGSWLTTWLLDLGAEVCGYSKDVPTFPSLFDLAKLQSQIRHEIGDVRDYQSLRNVLHEFRPHFVFHLAAQAIVSTSYHDPLSTISTNVLGTANVLEALRHADFDCTAIIITSDKCYENVEWPWGYRESDRLGGKDVYSGSKGAAEIVFHSYYHSFFDNHAGAVRVCTARAGNVIGGGDWAADRIVADCIRAWQQGQTVKLRSPSATRPWQHVMEPISAYLTLGGHLHAKNTLHGESFNFGPRAEQNSTVVQLLVDLAHAWGHRNPLFSYEIVDNVPFHEAGLLKLNCDKALLMLGWEPNLSYRECVEMTGEWYRRVLKEHASGLNVTTEQIREYQAIARERKRTWHREEVLV